MTAPSTSLAVAITAAGEGIAPLPQDTPGAFVVRVRTEYPDATLPARGSRQPMPAESSFLGEYPERDAYALAGRLAAEIGGRVIRDAAQSLLVAWEATPRYLSVKELAEMAGIEESSMRTYLTRGDAPEPDVRIGRTPGWLPTTAREWMKGRKRQ